MIEIVQGNTGYFIIELTEDGKPIDLPGEMEMVFIISAISGNALKFKCSTNNGTILQVGHGVYSCYLPYGISKTFTNSSNIGEIAVYTTDKKLVNIGQQKIGIEIISNNIQAQI